MWWDRLLDLSKRFPLDFISYLGSSLPIIIGIIRYKYLRSNLKVVWLFFVVSFIKDTYSLTLIFAAQNNIYIQNVEPIYQTVLVGAVFYCSFESFYNRRLIAAFTVVCTLITLFYYKSSEVSSVSLSSFRLFAIILSLAYFSKVVMDMRVKSMMKHSMFWFTSGLLIYATGTFFIVLLSEYWYQDVNKVPIEVFDKYWNSSQLLLILFTIFSAIGLWFSKCDSENLI
ncbi:hypothetical protein GCM10027423_46270 [Spirosoma arcticum]